MQDFLDKYSFLAFFAFMVLTSIVFTGLSVYVAYRRRIRTRAAWDQLAMRTGLVLEPGSFLVPPRLSGEYRRRAATLTTYTRSAGRTSTTYTQVTLTVENSAGGSLKLTPQGFLSGLGKALGMQDVQVGEERFDKRFVIRSQPPEYAANVLGDMMLRDSLLKLTGYFTVELGRTSLSYLETNLQTNVDILESVFGSLSDMADKIDGRNTGGRA